MKSTQKKILIVNSGNLNKKFILQRIKQLGHTAVILNSEINWANSYASEWIISDTNNHDQSIRKVGEYLRSNSIDGIVTFWEDDVLLTSKLIDRYNFIGIPYNTAINVRNKYKFREFCESNNLPAPKHFTITNASELKKYSKSLTFPAVVKPAFGSSSSFVIKANDSIELSQIYQYVQKSISSKIESALNDGGAILVEEYIDGDEVDIDILLQNGKMKFWSISDNFQTNEPFFVETGQAIPTNLSAKAQVELIDLAEETLERLGVLNGCIHFEAKYGKKGAIPIEVNLRMGGDEVWSFVKRCWKVDLIENSIKIACGEYIKKITKPEEAYAHLCGKYFLPSKSGVLSTLEVPNSFPSEYRISDVNFFVEVGDSVITPPADYHFMGWITASGDNSNEARENLEKGYNLVELSIIPFSSYSTIGKTRRIKPQHAAFLQQSPNVMLGRARIEKLRFINRDRQRKLHIGVACNSAPPNENLVETELSSVGTNITRTLAERGYKVTYLDFNFPTKAIENMQNGNIDFIFNVCERINGNSLLEPHAASIFDVLQIPYTGSNPFTLGLCLDKIRVKKLLEFHKIPTAKWDYLYSIDDDIREDIKLPLVIKPSNTDNSIGISNESVVASKSELRKQVEYILMDLKKPVLIEEYLEGDEYDVSILGSDEHDIEALPLSRTIFHLPEGYWNICPFEYKFKEEEIYTKNLEVQKPPKRVNKKLLSLITEIALDTYNILDCHDYGRVEVKLDKKGNPHVLELNPNPSINIGDCVPEVAALTGRGYGDFLEYVISLAINRYKNQPTYYHLQNIGS